MYYNLLTNSKYYIFLSTVLSIMHFCSPTYILMSLYLFSMSFNYLSLQVII